MNDPRETKLTIKDMLFSNGQQDREPAIVSVAGRAVSYGQLREQVSAVTCGLNQAGFGRGDRIALVLPNGPLLASAIMSVSASYACAPLNPSLKLGELRHHLAKLKVKAVVVKHGEDSLARKVAGEIGLRVLEAREGGQEGLFRLEGVGEGFSEPVFAGEREDAFLLHTSGTTAIPKLVPLTQANICLTTAYISKAVELTPADRCLCTLPLFHGFGLVTLLTTLLTGGRIVCVPGFVPSQFFRLLDEMKPTWYPAVPPVHQSILETAGAYKEIVARSRLRLIRSAAARLPPKLMLELEACFNAPVVEAYGMTEAFAIGSNPLPPKRRKPGSVGVVAGPEVAVMDEAGTLLGEGKVGEVVVRGPNVTRGYEDDDEENARAFINGWFRTGDLGHVDPEGYLYIDGRVKEIINRGGEKVTPNEVDDALAQHPAVSEAATFGVPHEVLGEDVFAAVVFKDGAMVSEGELQLFVSERLALHKVPSRIFQVKELPKGPSGKILRRCLEERMGPAVDGSGGVTAEGGAGMPLTAPPVEDGLIAEWNRSETHYPRDLCVHQIFEGIVARDPSRIAIRHNETEITYGELNARANRLARRLIEAGAGPGQFVGVYVERSPDLVTCFLAVLKAGAAYVPLFILSDSLKRIASYIEGAGVKIVLTKRVYEQMVPRDVAKLYVAGAPDGTADPGIGNPSVPTSADSPAYVLYVPGADGVPKGVCVPHRAVSRLAFGSKDLSIEPDDVVVLQSSPDTSLMEWEVWGTLLNGARMVTFDMRTLLAPKRFAKKLEDERVTVLGLSVPFFNLFASEVPAAFRGLKTLAFTGEATDPQAVRRLIKSGPPKRLINAYGATEAAGFATLHLVDEAPEGDALIPIGTPMPGAKVHILDGALRPVPAGSQGELYIGGDGVALGYLNLPVATREAFLPDPFIPGGAMFKTGDMARLSPRGWIEFLGRRDRQVKIHGSRVELGEVESVLKGHPAVRACSVAYTKQGSAKEKRLVAYAVPSGPDIPATEELHRFLLEALVEPMIPSQYVWVDELPKTPEEGGAVDQRQTRCVAGGGEMVRGGWDETERRLAAIWEEEMGVSGIRPGDNFFHLGGYSLMAVRIFSRMEKEFGIRLNMATIYRRPTLAALAAEVKKAGPKPLKSLVPLRTEGGRPKLFLVHAVDGEVYNYGNLVTALGEDQPVYGLRAVGILEAVPLPKTVEEMASGYITELKAVQPQGPYHIAGWCGGAVIAFEMARQLTRAGESVGLVGMLDHEAPDGRRWRSRRGARSLLFKETLFLGGDLLRYAKRRRAGNLELVSRAVGVEKLWMRVLGIITTDEEGLPGESAPLPATWKAVILNQIKAIHAYRPAHYDGVVTVFKRELQPTISTPDSADGWRAYADGIFAVTVKGRIHGDMIKPPGVHFTAEKIRERIDWHEARLRKRPPAPA